MTNTNTNTFWDSVIHGALQGFVWLVPAIIIPNLGHFGDITVSGILSALVFWLHAKYLTA